MAKGVLIFETLAAEFERAKMTCLLIGGFAVNHYQVSRQTNDIDFLTTEEDFRKILGPLKKLEYEEFHRGETFVWLRSRRPAWMIVDFMFVGPPTFERMLREGEKIKFEGTEWVVPSLEHLIALKLHAIKNNSDRELRDMLDIVDLIKSNKFEVRTDRFKALCLKHGTQEIYEKVLRWLRIQF